MTKYIGTVIILAVLISCNAGKGKYTERLEELDRLLTTEAAHVLDSLQVIRPEALNASEKAHYYLLMASATDKNYRSLENDSALRIAEKYYAAQKDYYNLSRVEYYLARYEYGNKNLEESYELLRKAEVNFNKSSEADKHIAGLIYYWLGLIQTKQDNIPEAEAYYEKSVNAFYQANDTIAAYHSKKQLGWFLIDKGEYPKAEEVLFSIPTIQNDTSFKVSQFNSSLANTKSYLYRKMSDNARALKYGKESIEIFTKNKIDIPSQFYYNLITIYKTLNDIDSLKYYGNKMLAAAQEENNLINLMNSYKLLFKLEEKQGNYEKACSLKDKFNETKDLYNSKNKPDEFLRLEKKYDIAEKERIILKAENKNLWLSIFIIIIGIGTILIVYYFSWRHQKLKAKNVKLSEEIVKTQWGFALSKELIADNHSAFKELERLLSRNVTLVPDKVYQEFQESLLEQKSNYSKRLFSALTNIDSHFIEQLQKRCPDLTSDEIMLASMIRHEWEANDIARVFRISFDALKKRKQRLKGKIMGTESGKADLDKFLSKM